MSQQPPNDGQPPYDSGWGTGQIPPDQGYQQAPPPQGQWQQPPAPGYPPQGQWQQPPPGYSPQPYQPQGQWQQPPPGYAPQYAPQPVIVNQKRTNPLLIILVILGVLMVGGCASIALFLGAAGHAVDQAVKDTGVGQTVKGKANESLSNSGWNLSVVGTERNTTGYQSLSTPAAGNVFYSVELSVGSSDSRHAADSNIFYAKLRDSAGHLYTASLFGKSPQLGSQSDISQGQNIRGWVTFEVPSNASGFVLVYEPIFGPKFEVTL